MAFAPRAFRNCHSCVVKDISEKLSWARPEVGLLLLTHIARNLTSDETCLCRLWTSDTVASKVWSVPVRHRDFLRESIETPMDKSLCPIRSRVRIDPPCFHDFVACIVSL